MAKNLNLFVITKQKTIALADPKQYAKIVGEAIVDITLNNRTHSAIILEVIKNLFIDIIIGKDILKKNNKVTLIFDEPGDELVNKAVANNNPFSILRHFTSPTLFPSLL